MKVSKKELKELFQNGHRAENNGAVFPKCQFCGMAQTYWDKFLCSRFDKKENKQ